MTPDFKNSIDSYFALETNTIFIQEKNEEIDIQATESVLEIRIDEAYRYILLTYGAAYVGVDLLPCTKDKSVQVEETVLAVTQSFRTAYSEFNVCPEMQTSYVISIDGSGDPIFITQNGQVKMYYHDSDEIVTLAENFEQLVLDNI